jgi:hypothetical protein
MVLLRLKTQPESNVPARTRERCYVWDLVSDWKVILTGESHR